jgi:hypothetical protein
LCALTRRWVSLRSTHPTALGFSNHHEARSAAKPPPKQQSLFHHRGTGREKKFKNDENAKIGLNEIK